MTCGGCASGVPKHIERDLPPPPDFMAPVDVPKLKTGQDARVALADNRVALKLANGRLSASRRWYGGVRSNYKRRKP